MATAPVNTMRAVRTFSGYSVARVEVPESASATFSKGAVVLISSGYLAEAGADPAVLLGVATRAGQNGGSAGAKSQHVEVAHPGNLFMGNLDTSGAEDAGVTAATDRGVAYGIQKHASNGSWYVDKSDTTNKRVRVVEFWSEDTVGDIKGRVIFSFVVANSQLYIV